MNLKGSGIRVLALVTDAYGGTGGIAQYNRDFLESIAAHESVSEIVVLPRVIARDLHDPVHRGVRHPHRRRALRSVRR